jgi:LAO/AO transport system kinase
MLGLGLPAAGPEPAAGLDRVVPVIRTCAPRDEGIAELLAAIDAHRGYLVSSGQYEERRQAIRERRMLKAAERIVHEQFERHRQGRMAGLVAELAAGSVSPQAAAARLVADIGKEVAR